MLMDIETGARRKELMEEKEISRASTEWELLFKKVIRKAKTCPALSLCSNYLITPERVEDAAGNHVFDDYPEFWGITKQEGHELRAHFQHYSVRRHSVFKQYIQDLIDNCLY